MNLKSKIAGIAATASMLAFPAMALASVDNVLFNNGTTGSVTAQAGATIPMDILISSTGTDVDSVWVNFPGAGGAAQVGRCYDITPNQIGTSPAGGWTVHVDLDRTPMNANLWDMTVSTYGLDAVDAEDNGCNTGVDFTHTFNGNDRRVTITNDSSSGSGANNSGGSGNNSGGGGSNNSGSTAPAWLSAILAQMNAQFAALLAAIKPATPAPTGAGCPPSVNVVGVSGLQSWLVAHSYMTQAEVNTGPGIYGPKTTRANSAALLACS